MKGKDKEYEEDDPMELVGMVIDTSDDTMMEDMARTFIDEFMRMGYPNSAILGLFRDPFYRAPHSIYVRKGEAYVAAIIDSVRGARQTT